jgi:membrane associated rhomboid family serine protease
MANPLGIVLTPWVKRLLIANGAAFALTWVLSFVRPGGFVEYLAFTPVEALLKPWTILTYMFVHGGLLHLLFNMLGLLFFGPRLEERWGSAAFLKFYLICGLGGAAFSCAFPYQPIIGASAAIYGILLAFALYWPDTPIYIWGILPVPAKWLVAIVVATSIFFTLSGGASGVAHLAHLGGLATGFLWLKSPWAPPAWGAVPAHRGSGRVATATAFARRAFSRPKHIQVGNVRTVAQPRESDVDRILDKISAHGIASLTAEERRRLEEASQRPRAQ